jgi:hypothetical protein
MMMPIHSVRHSVSYGRCFLNSCIEIEQLRKAITLRMQASQVLPCGRLLVTRMTSCLTPSNLLLMTMKTAISRHFPNDFPFSPVFRRPGVYATHTLINFRYLTDLCSFFLHYLVYLMWLLRSSACGFWEMCPWPLD